MTDAGFCRELCLPEPLAGTATEAIVPGNQPDLVGRYVLRGMTANVPCELARRRILRSLRKDTHRRRVERADGAAGRQHVRAARSKERPEHVEGIVVVIDDEDGPAGQVGEIETIHYRQMATTPSP